MRHLDSTLALPLGLALLLALAMAACAPAEEPAEESEEVGLTMLDVMIQIQHAYDEIEPNLRNAEAFEETADAARRILDWSSDSIFEDYTSHPRFFSEPPRFLEMRGMMERGARTTLEGAEGGDLTRVRSGFIEMKQSCIACHKRFSPSY